MTKRDDRVAAEARVPYARAISRLEEELRVQSEVLDRIAAVLGSEDTGIREALPRIAAAVRGTGRAVPDALPDRNCWLCGETERLHELDGGALACDLCFERQTGLLSGCEDYCNLPLDHDGLCSA
jgi:hypothetical protein